ncbi:helix-turn-helix domain-containing protein [Enterococcus avium]|uniref:helix-turn-helix domain-containing protein n=1 Tax=Enterococcus avium TaxID=33945 RepID=UPI002891E2D0|nr:helix-turn-helix domain-containing protein [Enterococcus avium]MDT2434625.1 helix-turn-helix domain-containing protein [Enterococcus avium]MDT2466002.1 helix-turn-helix domain-containing protein [Enterococcus avium]MDT2505428.1 helix-turn-helix domain-containing protein [Enterococcus avium]
MDYELFESAIKNKLLLLDIVYQAGDWVKLPTLCFKTEIGEKNVMKYMEELQEDLAQMNLLEEACGTIDFIKGKGFLFNGEELNYKRLSFIYFKAILDFQFIARIISQQSSSDVRYPQQLFC